MLASYKTRRKPTVSTQLASPESVDPADNHIQAISQARRKSKKAVEVAIKVPAVTVLAAPAVLIVAVNRLVPDPSAVVPVVFSI